MRQASKRIPESAEKTVRDIRRATRRHHSAEEKIRIVLEGLRGEDSIAELCRKEGINQNLYYRWSKEFLEAGKKRLAGARRQLHGHKGQLCVRSHRLSALEGPWPDHKPGLHPDEGGRSLRQSDDRPKPALADRLHLSEGHRLGLVLSVHRAR